MRIGANTVRYADPTGNRNGHDWDTEPAALESIRDPERRVGDEAGNGR